MRTSAGLREGRRALRKADSRDSCAPSGGKGVFPDAENRDDLLWGALIRFSVSAARRRRRHAA